MSSICFLLTTTFLISYIWIGSCERGCAKATPGGYFGIGFGGQKIHDLMRVYLGTLPRLAP
jgi:hypothetical protein